MITPQDIFGEGLSELTRDIIIDCTKQLKVLDELLAIDYIGSDGHIMAHIYFWHTEAMEQKKLTERALRNASYWYGKAEGLRSNNEWEEKFEYAKEARITDVVSRYMKVKDFRRPICCPFHKEKSPSFYIYPKTNTFHCFGCQAGSSPIDFVMRWENCDFKEAINKLN